MTNQLESGEWIPVADTVLAKATGAKSAGYAFSKAGFPKKKIWDKETRRNVICVEMRAAFLTADQVAKAAADAKPSFKDLVKTIEKLNKAIDSLKEENRQLRRHMAQQSNGLNDRARAALAAARTRLNLLVD